MSEEYKGLFWQVQNLTINLITACSYLPEVR